MTPVQYSEWKVSDKNGIIRPYDPWARIHSRLGGEFLPGRTAMYFTGTVSQWSTWTNLSFPYSGLYIVPGANQPVQIDIEKDIGWYEDVGIPLIYKTLIK